MTASAQVDTATSGISIADGAFPFERRPLYIVARDHVQVRARDEFLVVQQDRYPARHFAFAKLDRVVCNSHVDWTGEAMTRCLKHRVTISWLTTNGELLGYCAPKMRDHEPLHACLERFATIPGAHIRWENWFRHRRMVVLSKWAEFAEKAGDPVTQRAFRELSRTYVYWRQSPLRLAAELFGPFQSLILARLTREGAQCRYTGRQDTTLDLLDELTLLLWGQANLDAGSVAGIVHERKLQWQFLESWQRAQFATLEEHLVTFKLFVVGTLDSCP